MIVEITEKKLENMSSMVEEMLKTGGKLMACLEKMSEEMYGERSDYDGNRYKARKNYGNRRYEADMDEENEERYYSPRRR